MLDIINEDLMAKGEEAIAFDHDCREGICGSCGLIVNGMAHGPRKATTACQLHMRSFKHGDTITIEPWRAKGFPIVRDLVVDRSGFDRIIQAGGYISAPTGTAPDANAIPIPKPVADEAFNAAACIGCGACVAACPNGSAMLFTAAKVSHLNMLPQGQPERYARVRNMVEAMDKETPIAYVREKAGYQSPTTTFTFERDKTSIKIIEEDIDKQVENVYVIKFISLLVY